MGAGVVVRKVVADDKKANKSDEDIDNERAVLSRRK